MPALVIAPLGCTQCPRERVGGEINGDDRSVRCGARRVAEVADQEVTPE